VRPGDTVRGSDHGEIGTLEQVVEASEGADAHIVVPRGLIFETDTFIPLDALIRRAGSEVFINVPKLVIGHLPWGEPPARATQQEKRGPHAGHVRQLYGSRSPSTREQAP
jgi:ureidoacrylate peracid hydrolase